MRTAYDTDRFEIIDCRTDAAHEEMKREVRKGLTAEQKTLPCKYFYDSRGSALFERICELPEYYQTRTELSILRKAARPVIRDLKEGSLIEIGSGANRKIRLLLDAMNGARRKVRYVPVDVCESTLVGASEELLCLYPDLCVSGRVADFTRKMERIDREENKLITFFGGTFGNFTGEEARAFLNNMAALLGPRDRLVMGLDLVKDKEVLEAAYNDAEGLTAQFNRNILSVMNRELNATFDPDDFEHLAFYNERWERIEMHLRANDDVNVRIEELDLDVGFRKGETIFTEISRKFRRPAIEETAARSGMKVTRWFSDRKEWFALAELMKKPAHAC